MKKLKIFGLVIVGLAVVLTATFFILKSQPVPEIPTQVVELQTLQDGSYVGEYKTSLVSAKVQADVKDNKIVAVKILEHKCGLGKKAEKIVDEVVKKQSVQVDTVSGATMSSRVILKATELALDKGKK